MMLQCLGVKDKPGRIQEGDRFMSSSSEVRSTDLGAIALLILALAGFFAFLFRVEIPASPGTSSYVMGNERRAARETREEIQNALDEGDTARAEQLIRAREAHLRDTVRQVQGSSAYSGEQKNEIVGSMEGELERTGTAVQEFDRLDAQHGR